MGKGLVFLNSRDTKKISEKLKEVFGVELNKNFGYAQNAEGKIFMISKKIAEVDAKKLRATHFGLYIAKEEMEVIRLSIDATHFLQPKKNVVELSKSEMEAWMKGENIEHKSDLRGVVSMKYKQDFLGCGKKGNETIYNFVPKERRVYELH